MCVKRGFSVIVFYKHTISKTVFVVEGIGVNNNAVGSGFYRRVYRSGNIDSVVPAGSPVISFFAEYCGY